jgi:predicted RNA-binding protein YlxR (DUF448 family)
MGCNAKKTKNDLIRIVNTGANVIIDKTGKLNGRGAYICKSTVCLEKIIKNRRLERALKIKIEDETYEELRRMLVD